MKRTHRVCTATTLGLLLGLAALPVGCSKAAETTTEVSHRHEHHPPHGGTPIVLGREAYHIELVRDGVSGLLQAYVLDGEMENFVRCAQPALRIRVTSGASERTIELAAVSNPATGETAGDTSLYEARADWIRTLPEFDGVVESITVSGTTFGQVAFNFPRGNDTD